MTHICDIKLTTTGSDNDSSPGRFQAIIWTIAAIFIFIQENAFENVVWKMAVISSRPQCVKIYIDLFNSIMWISIFKLRSYCQTNMV